LDSVAVDVGSHFVSLCKWDGRRLRVEKSPLAADGAIDWADWTRLLEPARHYQAVVRCSTEGIEEAARRHGARSVRLTRGGSSPDPAFAAVRQAADRHRQAYVPFIEQGASRCRFGVLDRRGRTIAFDDRPIAETPPALVGELLGRSMASLPREEPQDPAVQGPILVAYGGAGPRIAAEVACACGLTRVLVPDHAGALAATGMLIADIVLEFREEVEPAPPDPASMRRGFGGLMDHACRQVILEGYDLDDTVAERSAEISLSGGAGLLVVDCETMTDAAELSARFRRMHQERFGHADSSAEMLVRALRLRVTIHTPKPSLPGGEWRSFQSGQPLICGPATLRERHTIVHLPQGWRAELSAYSGLLLEKT